MYGTQQPYQLGFFRPEHVPEPMADRSVQGQKEFNQFQTIGGHNKN